MFFSPFPFSAYSQLLSGVSGPSCNVLVAELCTQLLAALEHQAPPELGFVNLATSYPSVGWPEMRNQARIAHPAPTWLPLSISLFLFVSLDSLRPQSFACPCPTSLFSPPILHSLFLSLFFLLSPPHGLPLSPPSFSHLQRLAHAAIFAG